MCCRSARPPEPLSEPLSEVPRRRRPAFALALAIFGCAAAPAFAADPAAGKALATRLCASCHAIGPDDRSRSREAPPFRMIVANSSMTDARLREVFRWPHASIPNTKLDDAPLEDLVSYVRSLRPRS